MCMCCKKIVEKKIKEVEVRGQGLVLYIEVINKEENYLLDSGRIYMLSSFYCKLYSNNYLVWVFYQGAIKV